MSVAPPGAPPAPGTIACPRCATAIARDQDWCLACGAPARTRLVPTPNWRAPIALLAVIATLAGIALAVAFVALTNDTEPAAPVNSQAAPPSVTGGQPQAPAQSATTQAPVQPATTQAPVQSATTQAPVQSATTQAPAQSPTTAAPDAAAAPPGEGTTTP